MHAHYGIKETDSAPEIIMKAARKSYLDFCRRVFFQNPVPANNRHTFELQVEKLLSDRIPELLETVAYENEGQTLFDQKHHEICEAIIHIFDSVGGQTYGIAQRWLNLTLMNLVVVESNLHTGYFPIADTRRYFHVPVDQYVLEAATTKRKDKFQHGLNLKCAPEEHDTPDCYHMSWYFPGSMQSFPKRTQPFEYWGYPEYIEFQIAVRNKLQENLENHIKTYLDPLDWAFSAFMEVSQKRNK